MIFVTIGLMFPFDRMIRVMDDWAARNASEETFGQIGSGSYEPAHMRWTRRLDPKKFASTVAEARLIVAHAGMGSMITAGQLGKPIVLLPRVKRLGEHNTDHQIATANWLRGQPGVYVADTDADLEPRIEEALAIAMSVLASGAIPPREAIEWVAAQDEIDAIVFGAASRKNIRDTVSIVEACDREADAA